MQYQSSLNFEACCTPRVCVRRAHGTIFFEAVIRLAHRTGTVLTALPHCYPESVKMRQLRSSLALCCLLATTAFACVYGPYLSEPGSDSVIVVWFASGSSCSGKVSVNGQSIPGKVAASNSGLVRCEAKVQGLQADRKYPYSVSGCANAGQLFSQVCCDVMLLHPCDIMHPCQVSLSKTLMMFPNLALCQPSSSGKWVAALYGDSRSATTSHAAVNKGYLAYKPDFAIHVGDFVSSNS